jgi:hypothetical protein
MRAFAIVGNCIFPFVLAALGFAPTHASVAGEVDSRYALIVKHTSPRNLSDEVGFRSSGPLLAARQMALTQDPAQAEAKRKNGACGQVVSLPVPLWRMPKEPPFSHRRRCPHIGHRC